MKKNGYLERRRKEGGKKSRPKRFSNKKNTKEEKEK